MHLKVVACIYSLGYYLQIAIAILGLNLKSLKTIPLNFCNFFYKAFTIIFTL